MWYKREDFPFKLLIILAWQALNMFLTCEADSGFGIDSLYLFI